MINFSHVSKVYPNGQKSLDNVNLNISQGEMVFVTGHSGAGKSTLLKMIACLERPSAGNITIKNKDLSDLKLKQLPIYRRRIGFVYQDNLLLPDYTVFDNVALALKIQGSDITEIHSRTNAALEKVGLRAYRNSYPSDLSAGEQQRVGIARAVVHRPLIILADEPTGNLDSKLSLDILHTFSDFNKVGTTVVIATHDLDIIKKIKSRLIELKNGVLIRDIYQ